MDKTYKQTLMLLISIGIIFQILPRFLFEELEENFLAISIGWILGVMACLGIYSNLLSKTQQKKHARKAQKHLSDLKKMAKK